MTAPGGDFETEYVEFDPKVVELTDGGAVIGDITEFLIDVEAVAVMVRDGHMYVLKLETLKWINVEDIRTADKKKKGVLAAIGGKKKAEPAAADSGPPESGQK